MSSTVFYADPTGNELATLQNTWTVSGTPTDPSAVSLVVTDPTGAQVTYTFGGSGTITKVSTGVYSQNVPSLIDGLWSYVWIGTGAAADIVAGTWTVLPQTVNRFYTSAAELKSRMGITDTQDDFEINLAVQSAAAEIQRMTGRFFWNETGVRTYRNESIYDMQIDDTVSVSQLATDADGDGVYETVWTAGQFQLEVTQHEYNTASKGEPWPYTMIQALGVPGGLYLPYVWAWSSQNRVQVTGTFGWPTVPVLVRQASLMLSTVFFKQKDEPLGLPSAMAEYTPQIQAMLSRYVKPGVKVGV